MNFLKGLVGSIQNKFQERSQQKKQDAEMMRRLQLEAKQQQALIFEQEYKKAALEVARAKAKEEAAKASGLQKLRATNRARRLEQQMPGEPQSVFEKLRDYTQKNLARREENLKRTAEMRKLSEQMKAERGKKRLHERTTNLQRRNVVTNNKPTWY